MATFGVPTGGAEFDYQTPRRNRLGTRSAPWKVTRGLLRHS